MPSTLVNPSQAMDNDRHAIIACGDSLLIVVADGTQGRPGGDAAEFIVSHFRSESNSMSGWLSSHSWVSELRALDCELRQASHGGLTTGVVALVRSALVVGASVGDSEAHLFDPGGGGVDPTEH